MFLIVFYSAYVACDYIQHATTYSYILEVEPPWENLTVSLVSGIELHALVMSFLPCLMLVHPQSATSNIAYTAEKKNMYN